MTSLDALNKMYKAMPYSSQITVEEVANDYFYFTWRGDKFKITPLLSKIMVEEVCGTCLIGSNQAILIEHLLNN